jgi:hypothetical protein
MFTYIVRHMSWPAKRLSAVATFDNCVLVGCYAASSGNFLPTFRHYLSVPFSRVKNPKRNKLSVLAANNPEERSSHLLRCLPLLSVQCEQHLPDGLPYDSTVQPSSTFRTTVPCSPPAPSVRQYRAVLQHLHTLLLRAVWQFCPPHISTLHGGGPPAVPHMPDIIILFSNCVIQQQLIYSQIWRS